MAKFKNYTQAQPYLLPPRLDEFVGEKDLVRVVNCVVGELDIKAVESRFTGAGAPAYHPEMMIKVLVFAYGTRVYSSRRIAQLLKRDVQFMWLSGKQQPDFRTINRFRGEYLKGSMESVFAGVVQLLLEQGHIKGEDYFLDGTKIEADANRHKIVWKKNVSRYKKGAVDKVKEILKEVDRVNAEEDAKYGDEDLPEYGEGSNITEEDIARTVKRINEKLREQLNTPEKKKKTLKKSITKLTKLQARISHYEEQEATLGERNSYAPTDPDATGMRMKDQTTKPGYNVQAGNEQGFVVGYSVHQNGNDGKTFIPHMKKRKEQKLPAPKRVVADSAYGTEENYNDLESREMGNFLKYPSFQADMKGKHPPFAKERFEYNKETDSYRCPAHRELLFIGERREGNTPNSPVLRQYRTVSCDGCPAIEQCCPRSKRRTLHHSERLLEYRAEARANLASEVGIALRKRRGNECESTFGDLKHNQGYRRCRLRGIDKVTTDFGLLFLSSNIRKLCSKNSNSLSH